MEVLTVDKFQSITYGSQKEKTENESYRMYNYMPI